MERRVYCIIDTNDILELMEDKCYSLSDNLSRPDTEKRISKEDGTKEILIQRVNFNSCSENGRHYIFLELSPDGITYNNKIVFDKDELRGFDVVIDDSCNDSSDSSGDELGNIQGFLKQGLLDEKYGPGHTFKMLTEVASTISDEESIIDTEYKCSCVGCKYSRKWFKKNPKHMCMYCYISPKENAKRSQLRDTPILIKQSIEFLEKGKIIDVGRLGAHINMCVPYNKYNISKIKEWTRRDKIEYRIRPYIR